ncbi:hypothetical protein JCM10207_005384 [Rhodosporidiobolus poonsookiae]
MGLFSKHDNSNDSQTSGRNSPPPAQPEPCGPAPEQYFQGPGGMAAPQNGPPGPQRHFPPAPKQDGPETLYETSPEVKLDPSVKT